MVILSITGLVKTLLIIAGVFVLLRLIGRVMIAKRNMDEHARVQKKAQKSDQVVEEFKRNFGKTTISKIDKSRSNDDFVDYEEIKED